MLEMLFKDNLYLAFTYASIQVTQTLVYVSGKSFRGILISPFSLEVSPRWSHHMLYLCIFKNQIWGMSVAKQLELSLWYAKKIQKNKLTSNVNANITVATYWTYFCYFSSTKNFWQNQWQYKVVLNVKTQLKLLSY